jgi:ribonuclease Z
MRRLVLVGIGLVVLCALAFGGFHLFQRQIAERLFDRGVARTLGVDPSAQMSDGLHVYLCGTGSPLPSDSAGPCIAVLAGQQAFVFDVGSGSIRNLMRMGFPMEKLQGAYLSHLHSDHIDGLGELLLQAWVAGGRSAPLPVSGPPGTTSVVNGFVAAYEIDRGLRIAHHGETVANPAGYGGAPAEIALQGGGPEKTLTVYDNDGVRVTAILVDHAPVEPAYGYRVDYKGRAISISGDTIYSPSFVEGSKGVDVMLHEALDPEMVARMATALEARGQTRTAKIFRDIPSYHASPEDAARAAAEAGAKELVYYHMIPPLPTRVLHALWLGDARKNFSGPITVGHDGMRISLPAGGNEVRYSRAFR